MRADLPPHLADHADLSVLAEEIPVVFRLHLRLEFLRHRRQAPPDALPLTFVRERGKIQPVRPEDPVGVLIPRGVDVVAPAVGRGDPARQKAPLRGDRGVELHAPPDLCRVFPHAFVAGRLVPRDHRVHHDPRVEHAVLHAGAVARRIGDQEADHLRLGQEPRRSVRGVPDEMVIEHAGAVVKKSVPDKIPGAFHVCLS